jgi:hypothetical protein
MIPEELRWRGSVESVPKRCSNCSKPLTKIIDVRDIKYICSNQHCGRRGWGYCQLANGVIIDGYYPESYIELERYRF